jgi:hypothetical protein
MAAITAFKSSQPEPLDDRFYDTQYLAAGLRQTNNSETM